MHIRSIPDSKDVAILKLVTEHKPIRFIAQATALSVGGVHMRLQELVEKEFIAPPKNKGEARAYELLDKGREVLARVGIV